MPQTIYLPQKPWQAMYPQLLSQFLMMNMGEKQAEERERRAEQRYTERLNAQEQMQIRSEGRQEKSALLRAGYKPLASDAETAEEETYTAATGEKYAIPQGKFIPVQIDGKNMPGKYLWTYGNTPPQVVSFPRQFTDFGTKQIESGQGPVTIGFPKDENGQPSYEHVQILSKPEKSNVGDIWKALQIKGLMGLSSEDQRRALFPGLKGQEPKALRQIDIYAKSAGVDPASLRDGTLNETDAQKVVNKIIEVGDKSILGQLMKGAFVGGGGANPSGGANGNPGRELELLRKKASGNLTPDEEAELGAFGG